MEVGPGMLSFQADYAFVDDIPITPLNVEPRIPRALQEEFYDGHGLLNARVEYELADMGLTVGLFATNLTDEEYQTMSIAAGNAGNIQNGLTQEPLMWGVSLRKRFGEE
jgi:outer membrane receptor protein involved in Fe transport